MQLKKSGQNVEVQELPLGGTGMLQRPDDTNLALPNKDAPSSALIIVFTTFALTPFQWFICLATMFLLSWSQFWFLFT